MPDITNEELTDEELLNKIREHFEANDVGMRKVNVGDGEVQSSGKGDGIQFLIHINGDDKHLKLWKKDTFYESWYKNPKRLAKIEKIIQKVEPYQNQVGPHQNQEDGRWCYRTPLDNISVGYIRKIVKDAEECLIR